MDPVAVIGIVSSVAQLAFTGALVVWPISAWSRAYNEAPAELTTMIDEVTSTRAALRPLELYVRQGSLEQKSREVIMTMMTKLSDMEDELFSRLENHLGRDGQVLSIKGQNLDEHADDDAPQEGLSGWSFWSRSTWIFKRNGIKELARSISNQKVTILALQVAELTHQTVTLVKYVLPTMFGITSQ